MTMRNLLFDIGKLELIGNGEAIVGGRCCGDRILRGDRTTSMVQLDPAQRVLNSREIVLPFDRIEAYGRTIEIIDPGMTAAVVVPIALASELRLTWFLKGTLE